MQEKEQGREPLQQKYSGFLSSLTEKWAKKKAWRQTEKSKAVKCSISFVRNVLSLSCYSGQNHFWGKTSWESNFSDALIKNITFAQVSQLLNTVFVEIVSSKFMSLYTCIQALITCTIIHSSSFSLALLTSSKLYLLIDFSSVGDHLIRLCVLLCLYPLCTPVLSLYWYDLEMSKPSPFLCVQGM